MNQSEGTSPESARDASPLRLGTEEGLRFTILGCGSSAGVPRIGNDWGACDPTEPRNRRRRCSMLVERGQTKVLVDTSPDLREQLLDVGLRHIDGVLYTHEHADQAHGIDDLRALALLMRRQVDVYMDEPTRAALLPRFEYCFEEKPGTGYPAILKLHPMAQNGKEMSIRGEGGRIRFTPFLQHHGGINSLGFRFGDVAYSSDLVGLPEESFALLEGLSCWIVDALRYRPHPSHAHLDKALEWIDRLKPKCAVLTNLHIDLDYQTLKNELPPGVIPAYDNMVIEA